MVNETRSHSLRANTDSAPYSFSISSWSRPVAGLFLLWPVTGLFLLCKGTKDYMSRSTTKPTSLSTWRNIGSLSTQWVHSEDSDQTRQMPRLIWVLTGLTGNFVGFVVLWLTCKLSDCVYTEPRHEKTCYCHMRTTKTQISLRIHAV